MLRIGTVIAGHSPNAGQVRSWRGKYTKGGKIAFGDQFLDRNWPEEIVITFAKPT
jgi:hypothetical protein